MSRLLVITLGFRVEYQVRFLMRNMPSKGDYVLILVPRKREGEEPERAKSAVEEIGKFVDKFLPEIPLILVEVPLSSPEEGLGVIIRELSEYGGKVGEVVLCLSGGMRALVLVTLAAALYAVPQHMLRIEVDLEGWGKWVELAPHLFRLEPLLLDESKIINALARKTRTLDELAATTNIPRTTLYKRLKRLVARGLVEEERIGRKVFYRLTKLGKALTSY